MAPAERLIELPPMLLTTKWLIGSKRFCAQMVTLPTRATVVRVLQQLGERYGKPGATCCLQRTTHPCATGHLPQMEFKRRTQLPPILISNAIG